MSTSALRLLVVEGNTADARAAHIATAGATMSASYADVLKALAPDAVVDICFPADAVDPSHGLTLADYDGVAITGSALNLWQARPEAMRQVELAREVFAAGVPFFGSCWGLQVAAVAAGGKVELNPKGREVGFARKLALTEAGQGHPMHRGRATAFDAPAVHMDIVTVLPSDPTVTACNGFADVQAAEIRHAGGVFWGVQYHPEFTLSDVAAMFRRYGERLVREGYFPDSAALGSYADDILALHHDPGLKDVAFRMGLDDDVLDPAQRLSEISNWIAFAVRPQKSRRGRA
jgi:GMP synthase (glutamine-hydrolysing)